MDRTDARADVVPAGCSLRDSNALLAALPQVVLDRLESHLETRTLARGDVLHRPGEPITDLWFPLDCLISVTVEMRDGRTAETGIVGNREMAGVNALMGDDETTQTTYLVQVPGDVVRVAAAPVREAFEANPRVRRVFLRYTQAFIAQLAQNTACSSLHSVEQRYARWLLELSARTAADEIRITHEFVSQMLGVRRAGITELSGRFEGLGLVRSGRGRTTIVNREGLAAVSCECYGVLGGELERLLSPDVARDG